VCTASSLKPILELENAMYLPSGEFGPVLFGDVVHCSSFLGVSRMPTSAA
jgi:hypothetical protein